jgi:hypothetical protein
MTQLILAALFFIALHVGVAGTSARGRAIEKLGRKPLPRSIFPAFSARHCLVGPCLPGCRLHRDLGSTGLVQAHRSTPDARGVSPCRAGNDGTEPHGCGRRKPADG